MLRVTPDRPWALHDIAASRTLEQDAAASLPPHTLMQRAGLAVARLAMALAPHARTVWIACGPGNNGGDGFEAALHLRAWGKAVHLTAAGDPAKRPADAVASARRALDAGVAVADAPPAEWDLAIDAMLGLGTARPLASPMTEWADAMNRGAAPVLAVDVPSGLSADTGTGGAVRATHTISLLTLKPGLFTGAGRDWCGAVWFDDLGITPSAPTAVLAGPPSEAPRAHASHKGTWGDVAVIGGASGMAGAALLAASGALHGGAGRVFIGWLGDVMPVAADLPELMMRSAASLDLARMAVACGCGGGEAVRDVLPHVLATSKALVLDADGLNAVAADPILQAHLEARGLRGQATVLTPHPLEAARLLGQSTGDVQADRIGAAQRLAERFRCVIALKGSGTVIASPGALPRINPTGNARLATGGTGDVLAGMIAARLARGDGATEAAAFAAYAHGLAADGWDAAPLTAGALARRAS